MIRRASLLLALVAVAWAAPAAARARRAPYGVTSSTVVLDGASTRVRWTDGDSLLVLEGPHAGRRARLEGVNALETYGPVHRFGGSTPAELLAVARGTAALAAAREWRCATAGDADGYGRLLVSCPDAAQALVRAGVAMAFAVGAPPDPRLVAAQREAQAARRGMWAHGVAPLVPTSLHSADEPGLERKGAYDRIADTRTGITTVRRHDRVYATCEDVCVGEGAGRACMTYVPFERRYRGKPACIRAGGTRRVREGSGGGKGAF